MKSKIKLTGFYLSFVFTGLIVLPAFLARPFNPKNTSLFFRVFNKTTWWLLGFDYFEIDRHILDQNAPSIVVGNHQHNLDALVASRAFDRGVVFLGKKELLRIPVLGLCFFLGGNVAVDRGNKQKAKKSLEQVRKKLIEQRLNVVIFPEGTRNGGEKLLPFKRGAFTTAIQTQLPVLPFAVSRYAKNMDLSKKRPGKIVVKYLAPIPTTGMTAEDAPRLAEMAREAIEKALKEMEESDSSVVA